MRAITSPELWSSLVETLVESRGDVMPGGKRGGRQWGDTRRWGSRAGAGFLLDLSLPSTHTQPTFNLLIQCWQPPWLQSCSFGSITYTIRGGWVVGQVEGRKGVDCSVYSKHWNTAGWGCAGSKGVQWQGFKRDFFARLSLIWPPWWMCIVDQ